MALAQDQLKIENDIRPIVSKGMGEQESLGESSSKSYAVGEYFVGNDGYVYKVISAIDTGDTIVVDTNCERTDLSTELSSEITRATQVESNLNTPTFTEASTRDNIASNETLSTLFGKIKKWFTDLKTVAFSGSYNDLSDKPTIPTVNNGTLTIQKNGTTVQTFTANQSSNATANITVPTKVSELTNDSGYTTNTGTVTSVATGAGLTGGTITGSGTIKCDLKSETKSSLTAASKGTTSSREYAVGLDANGDLSVNVPWTDTNTTYSAGTGLSLSSTTFNHASSITAGTAGTSSATSGSTLAVPYVTYNATGHITATGTHTHTVSGFAPTSHAVNASTYGLGTASLYGHVKLSDTYTSSVGAAANSIGASQKALYNVYSDCFKNYAIGETINSNSCPAFGYITTLGTRVDIWISLKKGLDNISTLSITSLIIYIRHVGGGYLLSNGVDAVDYITTSRTIKQGSMMRLTLDNSDGWGITNNTPLAGTVTITATTA